MENADRKWCTKLKQLNKNERGTAFVNFYGLAVGKDCIIILWLWNSKN